MSSHPVCKIPFEPNPENYKSDAEHDANARKHWYLVLGVGLFTKKSGNLFEFPCPAISESNFSRTDADARADPHDVLIFFEKSHAVRRWKQHCSRHHTANAHKNPRPDDREDNEGVDAVAATGGRVLSHAPSGSRRTGSMARAASAIPRRDISPKTGYYVSRHQADRWSKASLANDAGVSSAAKRRREGSASVVPSVKGERQSSVKREAPASPVKHERQPSVKREQVPLLLTTRRYFASDVQESESPLSDVLPPLLYGVEADDVLMPHASPVAISATLSTTSSLSSDSSGSGEWISSTSLAAPGITVPGPSRLSALGAGAPAASSAFVGLGESISDARPAAARMGAAGPSRISALGAGARDASTSARSVRLLLNSVTRKLYPDPIQALAEVMPGESLQVVAQEEVVEYCAGQSARLGT
ncbi:hypothetical protein B0H14DRAFT_2587551 [Mycena olivaceomarginata]|nr:hypothetical protein B0H14DRAFT_2587551 [Mycena olivaceomarginata]